jgi:hypothetical protein
VVRGQVSGAECGAEVVVEMQLRIVLQSIIALTISKACAFFAHQTIRNTCITKHCGLQQSELWNHNDECNSDTDTIRVRIWRALANGEEVSLQQLSKIVGERKLGELRSHITHVERQAKTIGNKSDEWRVRRGLVPVQNSAKNQKKVQIKMRKGKNNQLLIRLC